MSVLIEHIDAIARNKGRPAPCLEYHPQAGAAWPSSQRQAQVS